ncbi:hypothetical protein FRC10_000001, partial [Ceratobasidium sp. 414]
MATYITARPSVGELRFIARLNRSLLPADDEESYTDLGSSTVEGSDVFRQSNGQTVSKFYSSERFIDGKVHSVSSTDVIISMVIPDPTSYEGSASGPFFRDINRDRGDLCHALYWYMKPRELVSWVRMPWSFHVLVTLRAVLMYRSSRNSVSRDTLELADVGLSQALPRAFQPPISVSFTGSTTSHSIGRMQTLQTSPPMKAETYTMVLYRDEFEVARKSVSVSADATVSSSIASTEASTTPAWRIGEFNGRPTGFRNADLQEHMHPSDTRMVSWGPFTYTVRTSLLSGFPMAQIKGVNNPTTIKFTLTSSQTGTATLRIGTTLAFAGGRPQVTVNGWLGPAPSAPVDLNSRGFTRGTYRGINTIYAVSIPSGTPISGTNTILINVISGSSGTEFLSPNF